MKCFPVVSALLAAASAGLFAAEVPRHPCTQVRDEAERLACYDKAFGKSGPVATLPEQFGFTSAELERESGEAGKSARPQSMNGTVKTLERRRDGKFVVSLDNDQVWSQTEINSKADVRVGDAITVRQGLLGSYLLVTKAGIATRVKRVR